MMEKESSSDSRPLAMEVIKKFGIGHAEEDVTEIIAAAGCYRKRDQAIREVIPEYTPDWKCKIVLPTGLLDKGGLNFFSVEVESPEGESISKRLPLKSLLQVVAASNYKQRSRMMTLYYHAEKHNYIVLGTGNKNEHDLGFFVKYGDGGADIKPIAHLYKSQVYQLADHLGVPQEIIARTPTTDTYSAEVSQEDFFFRVDFKILDMVMAGLDREVPMEEVAEATGLTLEQVERVKADVIQKKRTTEYLRAAPAEI
jgi:NAD+ synthase